MQDKIIENNRSINSTRPLNNDYVDKELSVTINVLSSFLEMENFPRSNISRKLHSPRLRETKKYIERDMKVNGQKMKET